MRVAADFIAGLARFVCGVRVDADALPRDDVQTVYFANHTSHLDFVVLWSSLPRVLRERTRPVAAQDYWESGMRRKVAVDVFDALLVPRHAAAGSDTTASSQAARETIGHLVEGMGERSSLIIFPEGTRGNGERVAPFKSGLYHLCKAKPGLRLVPVFMANLNRILPKGEFLPVPLIGHVRFGAPLQLDPDEPKDAFLTRARSAMLELEPC